MNFTGMRRKQTIIFILGVALIVLAAIGAVIYVTSNTPENIQKGEIKTQVSEKIDRQDFKVDQVLVESQGWILGKIASTNKGDEGNPALVILHKENNQLVLKFGPGTSFVKSDLDAASVPEAIQDALYGGQNKYIPDPIVKYMPHSTNFYSVEYMPDNGEEAEPKKTLKITIFEVPSLGIYATNDKKVQYKAETEDWIRSIGLDPNNYNFVFGT